VISNPSGGHAKPLSHFRRPQKRRPFFFRRSNLSSWCSVRQIASSPTKEWKKRQFRTQPSKYFFCKRHLATTLDSNANCRPLCFRWCACTFLSRHFRVSIHLQFSHTFRWRFGLFTTRTRVIKRGDHRGRGRLELRVRPSQRISTGTGIQSKGTRRIPNW
jgi:hypothetical protein